MNKYLSLVAFCTAALLLAACEKDPGTTKGGDPAVASNTVSFSVGGDFAATKSVISDPIDISEESGIDGLCLIEEVVDIDGLNAPAVETKGTPVFTENFRDVLGTFTAPAVYSGTTRKTNLQGDFEWKHDNVYSKNYEDGMLPESGTLLYFLQAPVSMPAGVGASSFNTETGAITFSVGDGYPTTASAQKDILYTSKEVTIDAGAEVNRILFYHVFSGVKFKLKEIGDENVRITAIKSVKFSGLINKGTCTVTPSYEGETFSESNADGKTEKSATQSIWSYGDTPSTGEFSQSFSADEQGVDLTTGSDYSYPSAFTSATANKGKNLNDANASKTFYLIPQTLSDNVKLTLTYTYSDGITTADATVTIDFGTKLSNATWDAGKLYTYTLSINDRVDVDIDDTVKSSDKTKSSLTITNTGTATSYMRVAVIGNWFYDGDDPNVPVAITPTGSEFVTCFDSQYNKTDWFKEGEYYYYKHPVPGGKTIKASNTLFGTLDLSSLYTTTYKPYDECHLEVSICVQAVRATQAEDAWGVSGFDTTVKDE